MPSPDADAQFDEFADLDSKLDDLFGDLGEQNPNQQQLRQMTQQFFKGTGDMNAWDKVDKSIHAAANSQQTQVIDQEWGEFADTFFGEESAEAKSTDPATAPNFAAQTIRFDFGGAKPAGPITSQSLSSVDENNADTYNLFLKKIVVPKQRTAAISIIADILHISNEEADAITQKPFIKILIDVPKHVAEAAHERFKAADLVSTIKKCV